MCTSPFKRKDSDAFIPCGRCYDCKSRKVSGWTYRLMKEAERSSSAFFVTLTYDTMVVPITPNGFMTLKKKDLQDYFKRLRKRSTGKIKYYAVGEYGSQYMRPHYHIILFNAHDDDIIDAWSIDGVSLGIVDLGDERGLTEQACAYTCKYISKNGRVPMHARDDRVPEFSLMSKGLGLNYLTKAKVKWHKADLVNRCYVPLRGGQKIAMPRIYKDKIYTKVQRQQISRHIQNEVSIERSKLSMVENLENDSKLDSIAEAKARRNKDLRYTSL